MSKLILPHEPGSLFIAKRDIVPVALGLSGHVIARLCRAKSGTLLKKWEFNNLLTNTYMNLIGGDTGTNGTFATAVSACAIAAGTGTTAPAYTDTTLTAEMASSRTVTDNLSLSSNNVYVAGSPDYAYVRAVRDFTTAQANGTIGEFGLFTSVTTGAGLMYAKCNPKDAGGVQTTISKTSAQTLNVEWRLRVQSRQTDGADSVVINGVTYTLTYRAANVSFNFPPQIALAGISWTNAVATSLIVSQPALVARNAAPAIGTAPTAKSLRAYTTGNFFRDVQASWSGGATAVSLCAGTNANTGTAHTLQVGFSPALAANQSATFRIAWARVSD